MTPPSISDPAPAPEPSSGDAPLRPTAVRVLSIEAAAIALLWWLQHTFTR